MKTTIGGDRLGSGNKQKISDRNYERSTHDLSSIFRTSMSAGTLVPFMNLVSLPGDSWDINLNLDCKTLPTIGPLFGSYKIQCDVFQVPIRLYNAGLHMNRLGIGMDMSKVKLPQVKVYTNNHADYIHSYDDNEQVNPSALLKYLGISGIGSIGHATNPASRYFNAIPLFAYFDIYKNYYANKMEERGFVIHTGNYTLGNVISAALYRNSTYLNDVYLAANVQSFNFVFRGHYLEIQFEAGTLEPDPNEVVVNVDGTDTTLSSFFTSIEWNDEDTKFICKRNVDEVVNIYVPAQQVLPLGGVGSQISLFEFQLSLIDDMRERLLKQDWEVVYNIENPLTSTYPYSLHLSNIGDADETRTYSIQYSQEQLAVKTYQSDLFNNWLDTEWIDGTNGVNEISAVSTAGDSFTIDALNLASKVYRMLNRIALSGGSYDDWLDAVYSHDRVRGTESPVYHGSLIKELAFQEVISNAEVETTNDYSPLGTLAGRGQLTQKHKGGRMNIKTHEPSYIMGIVSITPRIDYSQGNRWDVNLKTMDDFHKPALDQIGFQDLITDQMCWSDTTSPANNTVTFKSAGKQPAWINYMTDYNQCYGNFADANKEMFMTLNRRYSKNPTTGAITDLTTYIDPSLFNHIFAETKLDSQNFWVQIAKNITVRRKMSAKIIPNL